MENTQKMNQLMLNGGGEEHCLDPIECHVNGFKITLSRPGKKWAALKIDITKNGQAALGVRVSVARKTDGKMFEEPYVNDSRGIYINYLTPREYFLTFQFPPLSEHLSLKLSYKHVSEAGEFAEALLEQSKSEKDLMKKSLMLEKITRWAPDIEQGWCDLIALSVEQKKSPHRMGQLCETALRHGHFAEAYYALGCLQNSEEAAEEIFLRGIRHTSSDILFNALFNLYLKSYEHTKIIKLWHDAAKDGKRTLQFDLAVMKSHHSAAQAVAGLLFLKDFILPDLSDLSVLSGIEKKFFEEGLWEESQIVSSKREYLSDLLEKKKAEHEG